MASPMPKNALGGERRLVAGVAQVQGRRPQVGHAEATD
jgi:hypothetical protein